MHVSMMNVSMTMLHVCMMRLLHVFVNFVTDGGTNEQGDSRSWMGNGYASFYSCSTVYSRIDKNLAIQNT